VNPTFWRDKRVLLTGHTGFKGSWLSLWLQSLGARTTGYSLAPPTAPSLYELARVGEGMESVEADVRDAGALARAFESAGPEMVIHMAAQSLVRRSYADPVETYETNVMGTIKVLEAARRSPSVRAVLVVTSDKCYENREWVWGYREDDPLGGYDPYSSSKGCAEIATAAWRRSFFGRGKDGAGGSPAAVASARAGNVIGGGDWAEDRLLPDIFRALLEGRSVLIRNPAAVRPWQHVLEPLGGYLLLAERLYESGAEYAEGWNFGPADDDARPVSWIVERLTRAWGEGSPGWRRDGGENPHEAHYLKLDCSKARQRLGWRPRWTLDDALGASVEWFKAYRLGRGAREISLAQIGAYQRLLAGPAG
jgi:CDP-glucose 4,6-dehydratase